MSDNYCCVTALTKISIEMFKSSFAIPTAPAITATSVVHVVASVFLKPHHKDAIDVLPTRYRRMAISEAESLAVQV